ncbi:Gfo/Idh/MocA family protein [Aquipuribacter hungaricus]|uniref:Gfo/Idh/MocA family protein n=1 Tax=Aquipuribacter hungaricus TaxID=545624 RepID=A0ABV7WK56_9MICO
MTGGLVTGASVGFGFLGAGTIARTALAPAVHAADGAHLQAAAARDASRAVALEPSGRSYDDYAALLADDTVDVVYVSLANDAHAPWTVAALEAGKHVLCEKPLGLDPAEVRRMTDAAAAADRLLVEAWWYRWHPRTLRAVELVRSGALGRVHRVEADFSFDGDPDGMSGNYRLDPAKGGGALYDVGCYAVDAARWALGADALEVVSAEGEVRGGVDLRASARLSGPGGTVADVRCGIRGRDEQLVAVYGEDATLVLGRPSFTAKDEPVALHVVPVTRQAGPEPQAPADDLRPGTAPGDAPRQEAPAPLVVRADRRTEEFAAVDPYRLMVEALSRAVRGEDEWLPTAQDSLDIALVLEQARTQVHAAGGAR